MDIMLILLVAGLIAFAALAAFSLKYPRGVFDWPHNRKTTAYIVVVASVFLVLFALLWYFSNIFEWPPWAELLAYLGLVVGAVLIILGIVVPKGIKLSKKNG